MPESLSAQSPPVMSAQIADGVIDAELAALLWLLAEGDVPLVVVTREAADQGQAIRASVAALLSEDRHAADGGPALAGGVVRGEALEDVLRFSNEAGSGAEPGGELPDAARDLGVVLVLGDPGAVGGPMARVVRAHYVRPIERDAAGHIQRRPPTLLSAWNDATGRLDHFFWAITHELATRVGREEHAFDDSYRLRTQLLADLAAARIFDPLELRRYIERAGLVEAGVNVAKAADAPN